MSNKKPIPKLTDTEFPPAAPSPLGKLSDLTHSQSQVLRQFTVTAAQDFCNLLLFSPIKTIMNTAARDTKYTE